jgi:hypothetical protein
VVIPVYVVAVPIAPDADLDTTVTREEPSA